MTRLRTEYALKPARAQLGTIRVQEITRSEGDPVDPRPRILSPIDGRGAECDPASARVGHHRGTDLIDVATSVKVPRKQHSDARPVAVWEPAELVRFREVADADERAAGWRLTLCGLRRSEALGLSKGRGRSGSR